MRHNIAIIAGTRPNFVKIAPLVRACDKSNIKNVVINTGQHFDVNMAGNFLKEFCVEPNYTLTPSRDLVPAQFADIVSGLAKIFVDNKPSLVIVVGDVNSTLAASLAAHQMGIPVAHVEAGLRSGNYSMPEESNRIITDFISDYLFAPSEDAAENLRNEKVRGHIETVGNIMIDNLYFFMPRLKKIKKKFFFCTLHRSENVDYEEVFRGILTGLKMIRRASSMEIILPLHPRTRKQAEKFGLLGHIYDNFTIVDPMGYIDSLSYIESAQLVLTDSGGVQEEASVLGTPCLTLRTETERPITVSQGTNSIAGVSPESIMAAFQGKSFKKKEVHIPLWDGNTADRIIKVIQSNETETFISR